MAANAVPARTVVPATSSPIEAAGAGEVAIAIDAVASGGEPIEDSVAELIGELISEASQGPAAPHTLRVLVVDDSAMLRRVLVRGVERGGHICQAAEDGLQALEMFDAFGPDVVISDWEMPNLDGLELCRRIRALSTDRYPYFIFLTALGEREHILDAMAAGADDYLEKPLDPLALDAALVAASRVTDLHSRLREQRIALERLNLRLQGDARRDPLTGLGNRRLLREDLDNPPQREGRAGLCIALCDVDFFKRYNDREGHLAGDKVLAAVAATIQAAVRDADCAYRYGGEEFLVLLPGASLAEGAAALERVRAALGRLAVPHPDSDVSQFVTISSGVAFTASLERGAVQDCLRRSDEAMYRAKAAGRDRVETSLERRSERSAEPDASAIAAEVA